MVFDLVYKIIYHLTNPIEMVLSWQYLNYLWKKIIIEKNC